MVASRAPAALRRAGAAGIGPDKEPDQQPYRGRELSTDMSEDGE